AILLLQQQGKLSLDDPVAKFFPDLTEARRVTIRELLSHTSGYQDFWPQDYLMPGMRQPVTPDKIMAQWAKKPLDFEPGTKWQYSNTNYVIAGAIIQKVTGQTPFDFLQAHVFAPLGMQNVYNTDVRALPAGDARGYSRFALGPLRPSPKEGTGWMYGAGELAMTPATLARWDMAMLGQRLLQPGSWLALQTETRLKNGLGTQYGLGVHVGTLDGHRVVSHDGEVMGFTAANIVLPDDGAAVVVFTNQEAVSASGVVARDIARALFDVHDPAAAKALAQAKAIFAGLQRGRIDRAQFTADANSYFNDVALGDYENSLAPLGTPVSFEQKAWRLRGGMTMRGYEVRFKNRKLDLTTYTMPDGKLEQYIVSAGG
ncbi:MAG TPA: serine hydrolase domain-containing protein, partial [Rhodanobacteraceae bacterium]|nr:serine hydrolase domain-containing protein [Rhodanobacteraceae bacterium]